jgi:hypothetical protein
MANAHAFRKKCCCDKNKNFVLECFPTICPKQGEGEGDGWTNLFGYSAGDIRRDLRFFVRLNEADVLQLFQLGFPFRPFLWWDHKLESPQLGGGGQVWQLDRDPSAATTLQLHKDFLFGNDDKFLPSDPRDFRNANYPKGLVPPPNAFVFGTDDDENPIIDEDGVWLEVQLATQYIKGRESPEFDGFSDTPKRITGTQYDNYLAETIQGPLDAEFTLLDFQEIEDVTDDDGNVIGQTLGPDGFVYDFLSSVPREFNTLFQRSNHLFHHLWNLSARNFEAFQIGDGYNDITGEIEMIEPGAYTPADPNLEADSPTNIYFWQRWIAHAHPQAGLRELEFAVLFDHFTPTQSYVFTEQTFPNQAPAGTSAEDFVDGLDDGTYNCNFTLNIGSRGYPGHDIAQIYQIALAGNEVRLTTPEVLQWPRLEESPVFPNELRNGVPPYSGESQCNDPATNCNDKWGFAPSNIRSQTLTPEFSTFEIKVLGSPSTANDGLGFLPSQPTQTTNEYSGTIDHYTDETDKTGVSDRVFTWPTRFGNSGKSLPLNYCSATTFSDCCNTSTPISTLGGVLASLTSPPQSSQKIKFPICEFLNGQLSTDCYVDRGPDKGPVVQMDGKIFALENYLHTGIEMSEFYSTCGGPGLKPDFRLFTNEGALVEQNGPFPTYHFPKMKMSYYFFAADAPCTPGPCNYDVPISDRCSSTVGCQTINSVQGACFPDQGFGQNAGFSQNLNGIAPVSSPDLHFSIRGVFALGKEPSTTLGTVAF